MNETKELLKIIKCFINEQDFSDPAEVDEEKLYRLAVKARASHFLIHWANKCQSEKIKNLVVKDYHEQIVKDTNENIELKKILQEFETAGIKTLLVKGVLMKQMYPQSYMRQMCDIDIMTEEKDFKIVSNIMKKLGYQEFFNYEKHLVFEKKPFILVELHRKLLLEKDDGYAYFEDVWQKCIPYQNYQNIVQLKREDAYIFFILHLMLHFKFSGIQIRDILDVYLYNEKYKKEFDEKKLTKVLESLRIAEFEKNMQKIAYKWFGNEEIEEFSEIEKFILKGASLNNNVNYQIGESQGKIKYLTKLFFPEFKIMKEKYPILKKAPFLLPATWLARIFKDIFSKEINLKNRMDTLKLIQNTKQADVAHIHKIYQELGLLKREEK